MLHHDDAAGAGDGARARVRSRNPAGARRQDRSDRRAAVVLLSRPGPEPHRDFELRLTAGRTGVATRPAFAPGEGVAPITAFLTAALCRFKVALRIALTIAN